MLLDYYLNNKKKDYLHERFAKEKKTAFFEADAVSLARKWCWVELLEWIGKAQNDAQTVGSKVLNWHAGGEKVETQQKREQLCWVRNHSH